MELAKFMVRTDPPGSYDQILGMFEKGQIVDIPDTVEWTPQYGPHRGETLTVDFIPHADWQPLNDEAEALMKKRGVGYVMKPNADGVPEKVMVPVMKKGANGKLEAVKDADGQPVLEPVWKPQYPRQAPPPPPQAKPKYGPTRQAV